MSDKKSKVEIGAVYNIGIGFGASADSEVVNIISDSTNGDQVELEMLDFGGPLQTKSVAMLSQTLRIAERENI